VNKKALKITKSPQAAVQDDENVPCPACPNEKGYETKHPGESGDCKYGQVNMKVGDMVVFLYFILCLRSHIEVNANRYEGGKQ